MTTQKTTQAKKPAAKKAKKATDDLAGLPANLKAAIAKKRQGAAAAADPVPAALPVLQKLVEVDLARIVPSPLNPRKHFDGPEFEELVESVRAKGVISPIMVRPLDGDIYEIIYGERRWRAASRVAHETSGIATIPALVRVIDEAEAFDLMTIENLKRANLTELEEAQSFKLYVERNGSEALLTLAERTGIQLAYIRRRIMVMSLPENILQEWGAGSLKYGHLEQLARLDTEHQEKVFAQIMERRQYHPMTVGQLKHEIASDSPLLAASLFDPESEGCLACRFNSEVQKNLFAMDTLDVRCNKPECFLQKKTAWLEANWPDFRRQHKQATNGFRFREQYQYSQYRQIPERQKRSEQCLGCEHYLSLVHIGRPDVDPACFGDEKCFNREVFGLGKSTSVGPDQDKSAGVVDTAPRVAWHGSYFRDLFFQERLPARFTEIEDSDLRLGRLELFVLVRNTRHLHQWFAKEFQLRPEEKIDKWTSLGDEEIFEAIKGFDLKTLVSTLKAATLAAVLDDEHATAARRIFADHLGIDVAGEWAITEEYLQKKVKKEILAFISAHSLCDDRTFANYLSNTHNCLPSEIEQLKKPDLMDALLNSGVNLVGKVPAEILADQAGG